jgi:hypothetical protein
VEVLLSLVDNNRLRVISVCTRAEILDDIATNFSQTAVGIATAKAQRLLVKVRSSLPLSSIRAKGSYRQI